MFTDWSLQWVQTSSHFCFPCPSYLQWLFKRRARVQMRLALCTSFIYTTFGSVYWDLLTNLHLVLPKRFWLDSIEWIVEITTFCLINRNRWAVPLFNLYMKLVKNFINWFYKCPNLYISIISIFSISLYLILNQEWDHPKVTGQWRSNTDIANQSSVETGKI